MITHSRNLLFTSSEPPNRLHATKLPAVIPPPPPAGQAPPCAVAESAPPASAPRYLSTAEVAARFGRTPRTVRNWVMRGLIKPHRIGRSVFFREADIDDLTHEGT